MRSRVGKKSCRVLACGLGVFSIIGAVVEAAFEQLDCDDGEDELEQHVDDHDVEHVLERVDHAVEHRLTSIQGGSKK